MSAPAITVITFLIAAYTVIAVCLRRRDRRRPSERDRIIAAARDSYQGPDSLRLLEDLEAHIDAYGMAIEGLYEQPHTAPDPVLAAGTGRLWDAVRDTQNQTKGEL